MILSASPEFFKDPKATDEWIKTSCDWLKANYKDNLVNVVLHMDEQTPHIHAVIVPIDEKRKLNCDQFFGSKEKLRALQTSVAKSVAHLGIERGVDKEVTRATHQTTKEYRKGVNLYAKTKNSVKHALTRIPQVDSNFGVLKASTAHDYYKDMSYKAVKTALPSFINRLLHANSDLVEQVQEITHDNEVLKQNEQKAIKEAKDARKENFNIRSELEAKVHDLEKKLSISNEKLKEAYNLGLEQGTKNTLEHIRNNFEKAKGPEI
jgi:hypothetical protein